MTCLYKKPQETGREFVDACSELCAVTVKRCLVLPRRWETTLLNPIINTTQKIEELVTLGNAVYVNKNDLNSADFIKNYNERLEKFKEAYNYFKVFDIQFNRIMQNVNLERSETYRLEQILKNLIEKNENEDLAIKIVKHSNSYCYQSKCGQEFLRLKLTSKNVETWLKTKIKAKETLGKRISLDKKILEQNLTC